MCVCVCVCKSLSLSLLPIKALVARSLWLGLRLWHACDEGVCQGRVADDGLVPGGVVGLGDRRAVELLWGNIFQRTPVACWRDE